MSRLFLTIGLLAKSAKTFAIAIGLISSFYTSSVFANNFGKTYEGVLSHQKLGRDQLIKMQLLFSRAEADKFHLRAILTFQFGGYDSSEYVSYHYDDVTWNLLTGELTFSQPDQEVQVVGASIRAGIFKGELHASNGLVGTVQMAQDGSIKPTKPLMEPLGGEYKGTCGKVPSNLQLFTYRSTSDTTRLTSPFAAYEAKGQVAKYDPDYCKPTSTKMCTNAKIRHASYNFFSGDLILDGYPYGFSCKVDGGKIQCNDCTFARTSSEMVKPRLNLIQYSTDPIEAIRGSLRLDSGAGLKGEYVGYMFHENLNIYQKIRIEVATHARTGSGGSALVISAVGSLYFGESGDEVIHYRFSSIDYPNPVLERRFILSRPEADVDVLLGVESAANGVIYGSWNSHIFGRVGSFVATKNGDLPVLPNSKLMGQVSSGYSEIGGDDVADVIVGKGSAPIGSDNPFDPLRFNGYVWRKSGIVEKKGILGGSYDFYTGRISLIFGEEKLLSGRLLSGQSAYLRRLGGGFGTHMQPFEPTEFKRVNLER